MQQEVIVYFGIDLAKDEDRTIYTLYDPVADKYEHLTEEEYNLFMNTINNPPEPNDALKQLMKSKSIFE